MIKRGLLNFVKCLKYYFAPYGAALLFIIIGFCIAIPACIGAVFSAFNVALDVTVSIPSLIVLLVVLSINAESYVKDKVDENRQSEALEPINESVQ